ncbi:MAG TPA: asparagine synthase-related protein [Tepidisphaeraceae bacterium]|nr:asparagine synthase-related protein [Tepidisphaeraceae bacterium]
MTRETLAKMSARVAHRGPDGEGMHISADGPIVPDHPQVALAHRRLAILDPDPRANQPFMDYAGRWIVFNGEIYNFRDLRAELTKLQPDYPWRTNCDTEVLLAAYGQWGENCVERLNGMFAFAVWDEPKRSLFCAIDRMGQKPLYWAAMTVDGKPWEGAGPPRPEHFDANRVLPLDDESRVDPPLAAMAFSSELGALRELPWVNRELDWGALGAYLLWGYVPASKTIYSSVKKFAPARRGTIQRDCVRTAAYFEPNGCGGREARAEGAECSDPVGQTRRLVQQAVSRQLVADVPLGCFLSGGMDSSVIAAMMKTTVPRDQPVITFSIGFNDPLYDETEYAAAVAKHLGTVHHAFVVTPDAIHDLPALAAVFGEPFGDSSALPTHYLARETRNHVKVALSGDGGDELFGGYNRYQGMRMAGILDLVPSAFRKAAASDVWQRLPGTHPKSKMVQFKRFLRTAASSPLHRYKSIMHLFEFEDVKALLPGLLPNDVWWWDAVVSQHGTRLLTHRDPTEMAAALDRVTYLPNDLLVKVDRASMLHALEVRSPFMDHELVQFAAGLSTDQLLKGGPKRMLREAFAQDLPAWVFKRKKMGFAVPIGDWFRGELRGMLRDHLFAANSFAAGHFNRPVVERLVEEHESGRMDHSQRLYALLMLELWWKASAPSPS